MRYKVTVVELLPVADGEVSGQFTEGQTIFGTVVEVRPDLGKLVEALRPPRVRASRAKKA